MQIVACGFYVVVIANWCRCLQAQYQVRPGIDDDHVVGDHNRGKGAGKQADAVLW